MQKRQAQTGKNVVKNIVYGALTWILPIGVSFAATPIIVRALGVEDYGIYALVLGFVGYSFTFSIGRAITKYVAEYSANGETEKIRHVVSATFFTNAVVGVVGVLSICLLANWLVRDVFRVDFQAQDKAVLGMYLAAAIVFVTMLNQVFNGVLQGLHRFDVYAKIFNATSFALTFGNLILAYLGYGLVVLLAWNLSITLLSCIAFAVSAKKLLPEFALSLKFDREILAQVLRYSASIIGYQILANILVLFERGWITRQLGAESLTYYVVPMTLGMYIHGFISSLMLVIFPLASELKNEKEKLLRLYTKATKIVTALVVFIAATVIVGDKYFLTLWIGENFALNSATLLILHTITFGLAAIMTVSWQMTEGLGFPNYNVAVFGVCFVTSLGLMVPLTHSYGTLGIAAARLAGFSAIFISIFYVEKWFFGKVQSKFWLKLIGVLTIAATLAALTQFFVANNLPFGWLSFILSAVLGGIAYCLALWLLGFVAADEKILIRDILTRS